jgi:YD repeat-containing protein
VECGPGVSQSGQTRTYNYDGLERLTSESNPENGTVNYFWDTCPNSPWRTPGDLCAKEDNAKIYTDYGYDSVHRLVGFDASVSNSCTGFYYDSETTPAGVTVNNSEGRMVEAYTNSACNGRGSLVNEEWFSYSPRGDITDVYESTPNSGGYYHVNESYYVNGLPQVLNFYNSAATLIMPTITYVPEGEGRVGSTSVSSGQNPLSSASYRVFSSRASLAFGSGDGDSFTPDPLHRSHDPI